MSALARSPLARIPTTYTEAVKALQRCQSIDEAKEWRDKAEAIAGWARLAKDETALFEAMRFAAHCVDRMGNLLKQLPTEPRGAAAHISNSVGRPPELETRQIAAENAGLSNHQVKQALAIASIPEKKFEKLLEQPRPPTLTELARIGTKPRPVPQDHLKGRDPKDFQASMHGRGMVRHFVEECSKYDLNAIIRGSDKDDVADAINHTTQAIAWLEKLLVKLEKVK